MAYTTIDDPSVYFQTLLYTGNATASRALTNDGNSDLQPDWLWVKERNNARNHAVWDSTRGVTKQFRTNLTNAKHQTCLLYTSPSPRDGLLSRMPSSA